MATKTFTSTSTPGTTVQRVRYSRLWQVGLLAIGLAVVANLIVYFVGKPLVTAPPEFLPMSSPIPTITFTVLGVLAAVLVFALVGRFTRQPVRVYVMIATVALLLSLFPNVMMLVNPASAPFPGANLGNVLVLMVQHVVAAGVAVWVLITRGVETTPAAR